MSGNETLCSQQVKLLEEERKKLSVQVLESEHSLLRAREQYQAELGALRCVSI